MCALTWHDRVCSCVCKSRRLAVLLACCMREQLFTFAPPLLVRVCFRVRVRLHVCERGVKNGFSARRDVGLGGETA